MFLTKRHGFALPGALLLLALTAPTWPARAETVTGRLFHDLDGNGILDPGEPALGDRPVVVFGPAGEVPGASAAGLFSLDVTAGCQAVDVSVPSEGDPFLGTPDPGTAWRRSLPDGTTCPPPASDPVGLGRFSVAPNLRANLADGGFLYVSLGDSIAAGVSVCFLTDTDYVEDVADELVCLQGGAITVDNRAVGGAHSEDLLTPMDGGRANPQYIPNVVAAAPDLVTISIGGNDFLNTEPNAAGQSRPFQAADLARSFQELVHTRRSAQEILSTLVSELPTADVEINTVYDNLAGDGVTTDFHAASTALWNQMLRHLAWGQRRSVQVAEVAPEMAHQDVNRATGCGAEDRICIFDQIHPNHEGSVIIQHAVMESLGRVLVPTGGTADGFDVGWQELVATLSPTRVEVLGGSVVDEDQALALDGVGAAVPLDGGWVELSGFELPAGIEADRVIVGVRYRTTGVVTDDRHRFDASFLDFAAPEWTFTGWDTVTPLVGGSGTSGNLGTPSAVNAVPNVADWRDVTAMVTLNAVDDGTVTGAFRWPTPTAADVARLRVRLTTEAIASADAATVLWDSAWAWVYGRRSGSGPTPGEISPPGAATPLTVREAPGGYRVAWQTDPVAATYRIYEGLLGDWASGVATSAGGRGGCATDTEIVLIPPPDGGGGDAFFLVSGLSAEGLEGPLGATSDGAPRRAAAASCP